MFVFIGNFISFRWFYSVTWIVRFYLLAHKNITKCQFLRKRDAGLFPHSQVISTMRWNFIYSARRYTGLGTNTGALHELLTKFRRAQCASAAWTVSRSLAQIARSKSDSLIGNFQPTYCSKCQKICSDLIFKKICRRNFKITIRLLNQNFSTIFQVQAAASLLLESKMFYVPFLLNSAIQR